MKHTHARHPPASGHPQPTPAQSGIHVAIIMDGNGRWANARGRPRAAGHIAGARVVRRMRFCRRYLTAETDRCVTNDVRMRIIGRRDRIPAELLRAIRAAEDATKQGTRLDLRIAVSYTHLRAHET